MERIIPEQGPDKGAGPDLGSVADALSREGDRLRKLAEELKEPVAEVAPNGKVLDYEAPTDEPLTYGQIVVRYILLNPYMWLISVANLATYVLRYAQMTWGPYFLQESKHLSIIASGCRA